MKQRFFLAAVLLAFLNFPLGGNSRLEIATSLDSVLPPGNNRPVLLTFFSSECPSCYEDLLEIVYFINKNGLDVPVIGISGNQEEDLKTFIGKYSITCPIVRDERARIRRRFGVAFVPFKIILAGDSILYRDDSLKDFGEREKEIKRCLMALVGK